MSKHSQKAMRRLAGRSYVGIDGHSLCVDHPMDIAQRDGPLWLFVHGIAASTAFWPPLMPPKFRDDAAWVSASLPVHGTSSGPQTFSRNDVTPELFISAYRAVIEQFGAGRRVIVVGHSTGGYAGLCLAHALPGQVEGVVSAGGFADGHWEGLEGAMPQWARREKLGRFGPVLLRTMAVITTKVQWLHRKSAAQFAADKAAFLDDEPTAEALEAVRADARHQDIGHLIEFFAGIRDANMSELLPEIAQSVLVIDGEEDSVVPVAHTRGLAALLPNATLRLFPEAGHMIMNERRKAFWAELQSWQRRLPVVQGTVR